MIDTTYTKQNDFASRAVTSPSSDLPHLTVAERSAWLVERNNPRTDYPNLPIHQLFEAQVEQTPDAVALVCGDKQLTYRELNNRANQLAHHLQALGVKPDTLVAICVERSLEMVVGLLGVLKAGGAYIPIDPAYPLERRAYKLNDSQAPVILTQARLLETLPASSAKVVLLDADWEVIACESQENPVSETTSDNLAYVIYTSGSTGNPKGVMIPHRGMVNHSLAMAKQFNLQASDRVLQFSSMSFDIIIEELYPSLLNGAAVILRSEEMLSSTTNFLQFIEQERVTILNLPTAYWHELANGLSLLKEPMPATVRLVVVGGEKASRSIYLTWLQLVGEQVRWLNSYGPTETTVTATVYDPSADPERERLQSEIPIGRPLANVQAYILDPELQPVPAGEAGELYIGGAGLARGYLNRPDLTAEKFIQNPFSDDPNSRLYKTGDSVRYLLDGNIEFIGRIDYQVKIRGFRIELGEIEAAIEQHPAVQQTVVLAREDVPGNKRLVAYVVANQEQPFTIGELRNFLKEKLPEYMVPAAFVMLDTLPLTPNGKVDRRALKAPNSIVSGSERPIADPRNQLEFQLTKIWEEILGISPIGIKDNFFELGGHSLLVMRLMARINEIFGKNLPLNALFEVPTVEQLANLLLQAGGAASSGALVAIQPEGSKPPFFCVHEIIGNAIYCQRMARYLPGQPLYGLQSIGLNGQQPHRRVEDMAAHYIQEMQTIQPSGPYYLGGYSFGGYVAFEMARQLQAQGEKVALLALFDAELEGRDVRRVPLSWLWSKVKQVFHSDPKSVWKGAIAKAKAWWSNKRVKQGQAWESKDWGEEYLSELNQSLHLDSNNAMDRSIQRVTEANVEATNNYVPQLYPGRVTLFRAMLDQVPEGWYRDPYLGWSEFATEGIEIKETSSRHTNMFDEPQVKGVAEKLRVCLDKAQVAEAAIQNKHRSDRFASCLYG